MKKSYKEEKQFNRKDEDKREYNIRTGVIATGDIFCSEISTRDEISAKFHADAVDMECAALDKYAIWMIYHLLLLDYTYIYYGKNANTFDKNLELASKRCVEVLNEFLDKI